MSKVKRIGIKQSDGTYIYNDLGADAANIDVEVDETTTEPLSDKLAALVSADDSLNTRVTAVEQSGGSVPVEHASETTEYGGATPTLYGHTKLTDAYLTNEGSALASVGASSAALNNCYNALNNSIIAVDTSSGGRTVYNDLFDIIPNIDLVTCTLLEIVNAMDDYSYLNCLINLEGVDNYNEVSGLPIPDWNEEEIPFQMGSLEIIKSRYSRVLLEETLPTTTQYIINFRPYDDDGIFTQYYDGDYLTSWSMALDFYTLEYSKVLGGLSRDISSLDDVLTNSTKRITEYDAKNMDTPLGLGGVLVTQLDDIAEFGRWYFAIQTYYANEYEDEYLISTRIFQRSYLDSSWKPWIELSSGQDKTIKKLDTYPFDADYDSAYGLNNADLINTDLFGSLSGTVKWSSGILAPNGKIYGIPFNETRVLEIDPINKTTSLFGSFTGNNKWASAVLGADGNIYCIPFDAQTILKIEPETQTTSLIAYGGDGDVTDTGKFCGGISFPSGDICFINFNFAYKVTMQDYGTSFDSIMPEMGEIVDGALAGKWCGCVMGTDGNAYAIPYNAEYILKISQSKAGDNEDILLTNYSYLSTQLVGTSKWCGGALSTNGKIFCAPYDSDEVLIINPDGMPTVSTFGDIATLSAKYKGAVLGSNGKIYFIPFNSTTLMEIDPFTNTMTEIGSFTGADKWLGATLAPNGKIYTIPYNSIQILEIDSEEFVPLTWATSAYINKF